MTGETLRGAAEVVSALLFLALVLNACVGIWGDSGTGLVIDFEIGRGPEDGASMNVSLRVGTVLPLTGALELFGLEMKDAADLAAKEINVTGLLGGSLELLHRDGGTRNDDAADAATELITVEGAPVILGDAANAQSLAVSSVTIPNEVVQISPASTSPLFTGLEAQEPGWFWRTVPSDALQGTVAAHYAYHDKGWRNVAILARDESYGVSLAQAFQDTFEDLGGSVTDRIEYHVDTRDFNSALSNILAPSPDAIWWVGLPWEGRSLLWQWWINPAWRGVSWLWAELAKDQDFVDDLVSWDVGVERIEGVAPTGDGPHFETFRTAYQAQYGKDPIALAENAYDAVYVVALAAAACGGADSASVRDCLIPVSDPPGVPVGPGPSEFVRAVGILDAGGSIDYEGASGQVNFDRVGDVGSDYEIWNISTSGQMQGIQVVPEEDVWAPTAGGAPPIASFTVTPPFGGVTTLFTVDASETSDTEDPSSSLEVQWDWEDDGVWDTNWTSQKTAEHHYASSGSYTIRLRVRDTGALINSTTEQIEVASVPATGPWLDRIIFSEQANRSLALAKIINGSEDAAFFEFTQRPDKELAVASDQVQAARAFRIFDNFLMNPSRQDPANPQFSENPFAIDEVRAAMQLLIDRESIARDIWGDFAIARGGVSFHPLSPDYRRGFAEFRPLEEQWAHDPEAGRAMMFAALEANGFSIEDDDLWHDSAGNLVTIRGLIRIEDERLQLGAYYAELLRGLNFSVEEIRGPFSSTLLVAYFDPPDQNRWNFYTAVWSMPSIDAWDDGEVFAWDCTLGFAYCAQRPGDSPNPNVYVVDQELADIGDRLRAGNYSSLGERQTLIARREELRMQAPIRIFVDARESPYVLGNRLQNGVLDLFGGPSNPWFLKSASVPQNPATDPNFPDERVARVLNQVMFVDAWNPWPAASGWISDDVQRWAMTDFGMWPHPHTGSWVDVRTAATVATAGPNGTLPVPATALLFDATPGSETWVTVPNGTTATSKVTLEFALGTWHTGEPITIADVMYAFSNGWRRTEGDIFAVPGLANTVSESEARFYRDQLAGLSVTGPSTLEVYLNFWHIDPQEIAGVASLFPSLPWEAAELAVQTLLDEETANNANDAAATGRPLLDLTKGDSLPVLAATLTTMAATVPTPPGMDSTALPVFARIGGDQSVRWNALEAFVAAYGHYWPSNGPFILEDVNVTNLETTMVANRDYPWPADHWDRLAALPKLRQPENLQAIPGYAKVNLTWQAPASDGVSPITGYRLYRGTTSGNVSFLAETGNVSSYTDSAATIGVTYFYQVSAVNVLGEGPRSNEASAIPVVDTTSPTVLITSPADGSILTSPSVLVVGTASDDVALSSVELSTDGANWILAAGTSAWSGTLSLIESQNTIHARAMDSSGNTATVSITVALDTTGPGISITSPADGSSLASSSVTVEGTASDESSVAKVELSSDGVAWALASGITSWSGDLVLPEGPNTIFARATDAAGHVATTSVAVTVDTQDPTVSITSPTDGSRLNTLSVTVVGVASDEVALSSVELSADGSAWILATGTASWLGTLALVEGSNTIYARATDLAGNTASVSVAVTVDTVDPTVLISSPADGSFLPSPSVTVLGTASDDIGLARVELSTDAVSWILATGTASWFFILNLTEGGNMILARATDTSGNAVTATINVTVDTIRPLAEASGDQMTSVGATVSFDASQSSDNIGVVYYEWEFGDGALGTGETTTHIYTHPGTYHVHLTVGDAAGNEDSDSLSVTVEAEPAPIPPFVIPLVLVGGAASAAVAALLILRNRGKLKGRR